MKSLRVLGVAFSSVLVHNCVILLTGAAVSPANAQATFPALNCLSTVLCCSEVAPVRTHSFLLERRTKSRFIQFKQNVCPLSSFLVGENLALPDLQTSVGVNCVPSVRFILFFERGFPFLS
ncbi:hypothetical protein SCHPADRAFT_117638 [Schizopora paradoxa]|uniref:Hydrophobin n=1 Tax=Schizopora paradoxa TaxID=27342 RepID=A0A0H2SNJ5_9AGAM|nr:hypothetical protein SCHPADRAFT_117638 [Schizopora paradoxa]